MEHLDNSKEYLFNPSLKCKSVNISDENNIEWIEVLKRMICIRKTEELLGDKVKEGVIKTPVHLSIGQEAISSGVSLNLRNSDYAFGNHRSHGHYIAMGGDIKSLIFEVLGKKGGCSSGKGGSMHIISKDVGFIGSVPIVSGTIPLAVGSALYAKNHTEDAIGIAFFGDGAVEEGVFHESMNFSAVHSIPVLFVCENNQFSSHMHLRQRQPALSVSRFAEAHGIEYKMIDGNNVGEVYSASKKLIQICRNKRKPSFLEAVTYRWRAHVGPTEDIEIGYGRRVDLPLWKKRDPIERLYKALENRNIINREDYLKIENIINQKIMSFYTEAEKAEYPEAEQLFTNLFIE
jgi:TPP-dependent pyruvate/acetoin dehydrogenase alpha subunit